MSDNSNYQVFKEFQQRTFLFCPTKMVDDDIPIPQFANNAFRKMPVIKRKYLI